MNLDVFTGTIDETMAESEKYMELHPKIVFYKVDVSQLNNYQAVVSMLDYFGLKAKDSIRNVIGKPVNLKLDENQ